MAFGVRDKGRPPADALGDGKRFRRAGRFFGLRNPLGMGFRGGVEAGRT